MFQVCFFLIFPWDSYSESAKKINIHISKQYWSENYSQAKVPSSVNVKTGQQRGLSQELSSGEGLQNFPIYPSYCIQK